MLKLRPIDRELMAHWLGLKVENVSHRRLNEREEEITDLIPSRVQVLLVMVPGLGLHDGVCVSQAREDVTFNQDVEVREQKNIESDHLQFAMRDSHEELQHKPVETSGHGTGRRSSLAYPITMPLLEGQRRRTVHISALNDQIAAIRSETRSLASIRGDLLPHLSSGVLSVRAAERKTGRGMSTGWESRLAILRRDTESKLFLPLQTHGWTTTIELEIEQGEYLIVRAKRAGVEHCVAVMYTSATANAVYKALAPQVEHIFIRGELYKVEAYAHGITTPISTADDFHSVLIGWNNASATGKFAPNTPAAPIAAHPPNHRTLLSEEPIEAVWLRLRQLTSVRLARKLVASRAATDSVPLDEEVVRAKAEGLAFSLRNASDYFKTRDGQNVSQRVLDLYYGSMAFAFAEMLAASNGPASLADIEKITTQGHGLCTLDGEQDGLERVVVSTVATGFFASWMRFLGIPTETFPRQKPKIYTDLAKQSPSSWLTVEALFARIPEVADLFLEIFSSRPAWLTPTFDREANPSFSVRSKKERPTTTYSVFVDDSARLTAEDIASFPGPISQISEVASKHPGRHFRVAVDTTGKDIWWDALPVHHSPFERTALIMPAFGHVGEYRAICLALLYALSIMVRYRPSVWRRVQEGDHDHLRVLIEAYLAVVERVLPEQFLERITAQRVFAKQPGAW